MKASDDLKSLFPKPPYSTQLEIAELIYGQLQKGLTKLMIIQSPTGTGKTYSLLVPIISWLKNNPTSLNTQVKETKSVPNWLKKTADHKGQKILLEKERQKASMISLKDAQDTIKKMRLAKIDKQPTKPSNKQEDIQINSSQQEENPRKKHKSLSKSQKQVERQLHIDDPNVLPKLIFVSRTHTQLSQVLQSAKLIMRNEIQLQPIQIGSKEHLCINTTINDNKAGINEKCQYLLDHSHCPYYHQLKIKEFFNRNMEEANKLGLDNHLCPYFATRNLLQYGDIVCLPYSSILNSSIRNKIGINLNNSIIVFDEGHNVLQFQKQLHSHEITLEDIELLAQQIDEYLSKYRQRMKVKNYNLIIHLLEILRAFSIASEKYRQEKTQKRYIKLNLLHFLLDLNIKEIRIQKIAQYINLSNLDKKLAYFNSQKPILSNKSKFQKPNFRITVNKINQIIAFIGQLVHLNDKKQILMYKWIQNKKGSLKIQCLSGEELEKIIEKSRMTIIAGGTMEPLQDFVHLTERFTGKFMIQKYSHIIKPEQCTINIIKRFGKDDILFNHQTLNSPNAQQHFKEICINIMKKVMEKTEKGGGIVVFIQNYQLLLMFRSIFQKQSYFSHILFDGKEQGQSKNEDIFQRYKRLVETDKENHQILISVMGGKLSEGINFSDRLARSLIVFGLPYPNKFAPQIVQSMLYYDQSQSSYSGNTYYQNLCIRTLNQTIGRGIRHINDYVNIYLVDCRFESIRNKLSKWMQPRVKVINNMIDI